MRSTLRRVTKRFQLLAVLVPVHDPRDFAVGGESRGIALVPDSRRRHPDEGGAQRARLGAFREHFEDAPAKHRATLHAPGPQPLLARLHDAEIQPRFEQEQAGRGGPEEARVVHGDQHMLIISTNGD